MPFMLCAKMPKFSKKKRKNGFIQPNGFVHPIKVMETLEIDMVAIYASKVYQKLLP